MLAIIERNARKVTKWKKFSVRILLACSRRVENLAMQLRDRGLRIAEKRQPEERECSGAGHSAY